MQRQLALEIPLRTRNLSAVQATANPHFDSFGAESQCRIDGFPHGSSEGDPLFELHGNRFGDELGIELGPVNLLDVDVDLTIGLFLDLNFELVDLGTLPPMMIPGREV